MVVEHEIKLDRGRRLVWIARVLIVIGVVLAAVTLLLVLRERFLRDAWLTWSPWLTLGSSVAAATAVVLGFWLLDRGHELCHDTPSDFIEGDAEERVVEAIRRFEKMTSGELRVHLDYHATGDPGGHAVKVFEAIGMTRTADRNGVLFFVAVRDRRFAVVGDEGIDRAVPATFWEDVVREVERQFAEGDFTEGLIAGVDMAGRALAEHYPYRDDDVNELPDDISRTR